MSSNGEDAVRREIEELLPWHAAGTLDPHEAARVQAALDCDPALAKSFERMREELAAAVEVNEALGAPSPRAMDALFAKIDAEPARRRAMAFDLGRRFSGFMASLSPRTLAWATAAAALVMVVQAGVIGGVLLHPRPPEAGATLQVASGDQVPAGTGAFVLMRFRPQTTAGEITAFLKARDASIVDGPKPGGLYRVRIAPHPLPKNKLAEQVKSLQTDKTVDLVLPSE
jgi:hypothetical protein